ncbi:hypothetical protein GQ55_4G248400 [Panicum hallii var. hallii]|uniref:Uncharacterized protein n=1 Tax=Panicum hallii var. hallii TaxID=1504633 RepID=A0A2T7DZW8_9POAL|nr:hypothetical protein GQ55_4G248400 [Panicum hallii var. hallii]
MSRPVAPRTPDPLPLKPRLCPIGSSKAAVAAALGLSPKEEGVGSPRCAHTMVDAGVMGSPLRALTSADAGEAGSPRRALTAADTRGAGSPQHALTTAYAGGLGSPRRALRDDLTAAIAGGLGSPSISSLIRPPTLLRLKLFSMMAKLFVTQSHNKQFLCKNSVHYNEFFIVVFDCSE